MKTAAGLLESLASLPVLKPFFWEKAKRFIAGTTVTDLLVQKRFLNSLGFPIIVNPLGEDAQSFQSIQLAQEKHLELMRFLNFLETQDGKYSQYPQEFSLKPSEYGLGDNCGEIHYSWWDDCPEMTEVCKMADEAGLRLWLDAELLDVREELWKFAKSILDEVSFLGIAYQAYGDGPLNSKFFFQAVVEPLVASLPKGKTLGLRLCKGAYSSEKYILRDQRKIQGRYLELTEPIMELAKTSHAAKDGGIFLPEFATHDPALIYNIKWMASRAGLEKEWFRFSMLLGRQQTLASHLLAEGYQVFIYMPFGEHWLHYVCRRLQENWKYLFISFRREGKYHVCSFWPESCSLNA